MFATLRSVRQNICVLSKHSKDATRAPGLTTRNKKLVGAKGIATRSKDATRGSWPYYCIVLVGDPKGRVDVCGIADGLFWSFLGSCFRRSLARAENCLPDWSWYAGAYHGCRSTSACSQERKWKPANAAEMWLLLYGLAAVSPNCAGWSDI